MNSTRGFSDAFHDLHDGAISSPASFHCATAEEHEGVGYFSPSRRLLQSIEPPDHDGDCSTSTILHTHDSTVHDAPSPSSQRHRRSSRLTTCSTISSLPADMDTDIAPAASDPAFTTSRTAAAPFTPHPDRPVFRTPSSVRALQMGSPPPFSHLSSPRSSRQYYALSPSSRAHTPLRTRSIPPASPKPSVAAAAAAAKKEHPLVLLHVTLLPVTLPYPPEAMHAILPGSIIETCALLREKASDTVLRRGVLIPHPREDYEVLEERLLEALELRTPRILKCGHFVGGKAARAVCGEDGARFGDVNGVDSGYEEDGSSSSSSSSVARSGGHDLPNIEEDIDPAERCADCGRRIKDPKFGVGDGSRRFEMRVYAGNGLMRAGAWAAAWKEMERVDVEIGVWLPEGLRRELDEWVAREEEGLIPEEVDGREIEGEATADFDGRSALREEVRNASDHGMGEAKRLFEIHLQEEKRERRPSQRTAVTGPRSQVPLVTLLQNYLYGLAQYRRNVAIFALAVLLLFVSLKPTQTSLPASQSLRFNDTGSPDAGVVAPGFSPEIFTETQTVFETQTQTQTVSQLAAASLTAGLDFIPLELDAEFMEMGDGG